jgi:hypothetical protein
MDARNQLSAGYYVQLCFAKRWSGPIIRYGQFRRMADAALKNMSERLDAMYAKTGGPRCAPEGCYGRN